MSGAVAAHAAYNGSGTQGLAVTNKIHDDDGDVMSVFWNKNDTTRQLLYGSSIIEIPASGSGGNLTAGGNQIFTVNNDIDALGDLYLQITTSSTSSSLTLSSFDLLACIKRIEFMVGTQVWQTLETNDIGALNMTEMSEDAFESFTLAMSGGFLKNGRRNQITAAYDSTSTSLTSTASTDVTGVLRIPMLSRSVGPKLAKFTDISENSYLLAGAPHQAVKIRVYMTGTLPSSLSGVTGFDLRLFGQCVVMCNEEREQIKAMPMGLPKRLKMTQNTTTKVTVTAGNSPVTVPLDLDHFSLFASHIILYVTGTSGVTNSSINTAELKLNSSSFSGTLDGPLLTGSAADALGLYSNGFFIDGANVTDNFYVFPLASHAYGGSSVPLNRFDNIRMELSIAYAGSGTLTVSATCVGETTALYKGGAASLAMY
jgi:hypothetical protein